MAGVSLSPAARPIITPLRRAVSGRLRSYSTAAVSRMSTWPYPSVAEAGSSQTAAVAGGKGTRARGGQPGYRDCPRDSGQDGEDDRRERRIGKRQLDQPQLVQVLAV